MKPSVLGILAFFAICIPSLLSAQTNRYLNPSGSDAGDCTNPHSPCASVDYAITQSATNDILNLSEGSFSACDVSIPITVSGMGSSTIIASMDITATTSMTNQVYIENVSISGGATPGIAISTSYVNVSHTSVNGFSRNIELDNASAINNITISDCALDDGSHGLRITNQTAVDFLTISNTSFDRNTIGFYAQNDDGSNQDLSNLTIRNCSFIGNLRKGIYAEKLQTTLIENISIINSGTDATYDFNNGIDINLKSQAYDDITIRNSRIIGCGAIGINDIAIAPENRASAAIAIKARTDAPSYNGTPAALTNLTLDGVLIDGLVGDLRLGEFGQPDNDGIDMSTVIISHCSFANDNNYALVNEENTNTLTISNNYWGGGSVSIDDYGTSAFTSQSSELTNEIVDENDVSYTSVANAIAGAGTIIQNLPVGNIAGTTTVNRALTLVAPGAGRLESPTYQTSFENLTVNGGDLTLGSDIAVSGILNLTDDVIIDDYNMVVNGTISGIGNIVGSTTGGLYIGGNSALTTLLTTSTFDRVEINRDNGSVSLSADLSTSHLDLIEGTVDASAFDIIFSGLTATSGASDAFVQGDFVYSVNGSTTGNKLYFPTGETYFHPITIEGVDQSATTTYTGIFTEADPNGLSTNFSTAGINNVIDNVTTNNYWTVTPSSVANVTGADRVVLTYDGEDQVSETDQIRVTQLQNWSDLGTFYWVNLGGLGASPLSSGATPPNAIDTDLGDFTLGDETAGTNFTSIADVYVDAVLGDDANDGSAAGASFAKQTLNAGYALVSDAGTINIADGTYSEAVTINKQVTLTGTGTPVVDEVSLNNSTFTFSSVSADIVNIGSPALIQDGIDLASDPGTVNVDEGTYAETLAVDKAIALNGNNVGVASYEERDNETIIDPGSEADAITVTATGATIDGVQIGTSNVSSNALVGVTSTGFSNLTVQNNLIYANSAGVAIASLTSGTALVNQNNIEMINLEDRATTNGSVGVYAYSLTTSTDAEISSNNISNATFGIVAFGADNSGDPLLISSDTLTACTMGINTTNDDGSSNYANTIVDIQNIVMSGFVDPDPDLASLPSFPPQAGIYSFVSTDGAAGDDVTVDVNGADISGVGSSDADYSAIYLGDFADDDNDITYTVTNANLHDNENRAVYVRGNQSTLTMTQSTFSNNGFDPEGSGGNYGFNIVVRVSGNATITNSYLTSPGSQLGSQFDGISVQDASCTLDITDSYFDQNGNGLLAGTGNADLSGNYFNSVDETTINTWVSGNDFTPYLATGTDTDDVTNGFQPDASGYYVTLLGAQTSGVRLQEAHDATDATGTLNINAGSYTGGEGTVTVDKNITFAPSTTPDIDNIEMDGAGQTLTISNDLLINTALTLTDGRVDVSAGTLQLGTSAADFSLSETTSNYVTGNVTMLARAMGTGAFNFLGADINAGSGADVGNITISRNTGSNAIVTSGQGTTSIASVWDITADNPPTSRDITFSWLSVHDNAKDLTQMSVFRNPGPEWELTDGPIDVSGSGDPRTITASGVSAFSLWTAAQDDQPLPVELMDFQAIKAEKRINLEWATASENNSNYFEVQRSDDGQTFESIGQVAASNNSNEILKYEYSDASYSELSTKLYYRLRIVDLDESYEFSDVVSVRNFGDSDLSIYPNPAQDILNIGSDIDWDDIRLFNSMGIQVPVKYNAQQLNIGQLAEGMYILRLSAREQIIHRRFMKE